MLKKLIIILLMFLSTNFLLSEIDVLKSKTYGGVNSEYGFSLLQTSDNGYAILGKISQGVWLIKTDENGDTLWTKTYGGMNETRRFCLVQTYDNGYAILGTESQDICLIRTNENGDMLWTKTYGGSKTEFARSLIQTNDNGYAILSYTDSFGAGQEDIWLIKTDENGDMLWTKTYGGTNSDIGHSIIQTDNSGFIIVGYTQSYGAGNKDIWLIKTDENGDTLWTKTYGGTDIDAAYAIIQTLDGELAILAETGSYGEGSYDIWFLKTNKNGDILWTELFGGEGFDVCASLVQANDDGYVILGYTNSYGVGSLDIWLIKIDENGNFLWSKTFGGSSSEYASSIINILGGYAVLGWTSSYGSGYSDIWFLILNKSVEKPKSLTSVSGNGKAFLFWDECKDSSVIQCNIYRDTTLSSSTLIDSITGTPFPKTYVDTTVENYNTYYYKIKFVNNYGHESPFSNTVVVSPNLFSTKTKFTTSGAIQAGITMLYNNTLYAPSSGDKVYRYDTTGTVMYSLNVNGNIKSSSTITSDHNVYIASTDYNLYSFNASGVSNSGWPKALGSEATASVAVDVSGNCYIGTENGIFQCIASSGDMNWSFNVGAAVYASAAISADNTLYVVNANGKVYAFNLNTLDPSSISPNWLYEIGESVSSSPALDLDGNLYITTEGGRIVKLHDNGSSAESIWDINTDQKYTASPVISSNGTLIIGGENNILYAVNTSDGNIVWQQTLNGKIKSTASLAEIGTEKDRLYVGDDSGILYAIYLEDGEYIWQYKTKSAIQCPILYANNHIYFGTIGGSIISVEDKFTTGAMEKQSSTPSPIWPTFQGNNQRTGAQMPTTSTVYPGDTNNDGTVDEFDVLPIGVYFLEEGPSRTDASSVWEGQDVTSWPGYPANYADCNGDGVVDEKDIIPVGINWGSTRATSIQKHMINPNDKQMLVKHKEAFETIYNSVDGIDSEPAKAIRQLLETTLEIIPKTITLLPCYPNPFNPSTEIRFSLPEEMSVTLKVYDINGRFIKTLINSSELDMGYHTVTFNGDLYPSGMYIYVLQTTESVNAQKMMLIK